MIKENNYAFIDSQNVNLNIRNQGWILDFARFRVYLREKYGITKAFLFVGYIPKNQKMYDFLKECGYVMIFKPVVEFKGGAKGNCDAELVLHTTIELQNFNRAIIVSGDGDFACLVEYLCGIGKFGQLIVPNKRKYSKLFRSVLYKKNISFMDDMRNSLELKPKMPSDKPNGTFVGGST